MRIWKSFTFEAAHFLPNCKEGHKCRRIHGHSFTVKVEAEGTVDPHLGWVMDFDEISKHAKPLIKLLDHTVLNDFAGLENPTSENIALWFWDRLSKKLAGQLRAVEVQETCTSGARYEPD